jgi:hypothetical protein
MLLAPGHEVARGTCRSAGSLLLGRQLNAAVVRRRSTYRCQWCGAGFVRPVFAGLQKKWCSAAKRPDLTQSLFVGSN